jgi:hypothetical protein
MGWAGQFGTRAEATYGTLAGAINERFVFDSESIAKRGVIVDRDGLRGTRSHQSDDTRVGPYTVGGTIVLRPTPEDLAIWFPRILGADASGTTYALAETIPGWSMSVDRVTKVFSYVGCKVNRATFTGSKGGMLTLALDVIAQKEGAIDAGVFTEGAPQAAGSFPTLTAGITQPYMFQDLVLTLASSAREVEDFELVIDNALVGERFFNSTTIRDLPPGDRLVTLRTSHDYDSTNAALYGQALAGAAGTLVFTNANYSTTFTFGTLQVPAESPTVGGKGPIMLTLNMVARKLSTTMELAVTHDSTP